MATDTDQPGNLHDLAVEAEADVEALATGLAHAGVDPQAVQQVTQCAAVLRGVIKALGNSAPPSQPAQQPAQGHDLGSAVAQFHQQQVAAAQQPQRG